MRREGVKKKPGQAVLTSLSSHPIFFFFQDVQGQDNKHLMNYSTENKYKTKKISILNLKISINVADA